jgi:hypothetical protein
MEPEDIKILSLGAIWNRAVESWYEIMGHKGPVDKA